MPSPFPGMDPYLEHPGLWPGVHAALIAAARELLGALLPMPYWVDIEERLYVELEDVHGRAIQPDLTLSTERRREPGGGPENEPVPGYVAVQEALEVPNRETYIVIRHMPDRRVVTVLEVLSPANKRAGAGRDEFLRKREEALRSAASLVDIDLLREGDRHPCSHGLASHDYLVVVRRAWERGRSWARGWTLREPLPPVPVPLLRGDPAPSLDLAALLRRVYVGGSYERVLDYSAAPVPPLAPSDDAWAREVVLHA